MSKLKAVFLILLAGLATASARADLIPISVQNTGFNNVSAGSVTVFAGSTGNLVSGTLTNVGPDSVIINSSDGFGFFDVSVGSDPGSLYFSNVDSSPFSPPDTLPSGSGPVDVDLFTFDVSPDTPVGSYIDWAYAVVDAAGDSVGVGNFTIVVATQTAEVPEPVPAGLMGLGLCLGAAIRLRGRLGATIRARLPARRNRPS
ncbi:MAG TPA: hypothetical protein VG273_25655 [Bryobacteraceae bacterium]|jgi:hypothetical protein|nr:hypothetical protein [Bryobacteraceae bacterium]